LYKPIVFVLDVLQNEEDKPTPKTSTNTNKTLKQIKITTNNIETTQDSPSQNFNKTPKIIEKPAENLELNLIGKEFLNFVIKGDPLPHIEMWIEKQSGNCKIIEPWRKVCFKCFACFECFLFFSSNLNDYNKTNLE